MRATSTLVEVPPLHRPRHEREFLKAEKTGIFVGGNSILVEVKNNSLSWLRLPKFLLMESCSGPLVSHPGCKSSR